MKLIFCKNCWDVFKLTVGELRACGCGRCVGQYDDNRHTAVTNGEGYALAIGNGSLLDAIRGEKYPYRDYYGYRTVMCWVRDHDGETNPNSRVDKGL